MIRLSKISMKLVLSQLSCSSKLPDGTVKVLVEGGKRRDFGYVDNPNSSGLWCVREEETKMTANLKAPACRHTV